MALGVSTLGYRWVASARMQYNPEPLYHHYRDKALQHNGTQRRRRTRLCWTFDERVWTAAICARIALMRKPHDHDAGYASVFVIHSVSQKSDLQLHAAAMYFTI